MAHLTAEQLAIRAGVSQHEIDRLTRLGILKPATGAEPFRPGDVHRVRLVMACERAGLSAEHIASAIDAGHLSLSFVDAAFTLASSATQETFAAAYERNSLPEEIASRGYQAAGLPAPDPKALATEDDLAIVAGFALAMRLGVDTAGVQAATRVYGESMRRIAEMNAGLYHEYIETPLLASGMTEAQMRELAVGASGDLVPVTDRMLMGIYRRHDDRSIMQHIVEHIEAELQGAGLIGPRTTSPAMCFLDLTGFTRLTEELGDRAAADLAGDLAGMAQSVSARHDGHPVKWLGDGVMLYFEDPRMAVGGALEMVAEAPALGVPAAHAGLAAGSVVHQDGDYFGRTVNLAARIAGRAGPGEVLANSEVAEAGHQEAVTFEPLGPVELKGFANPVPLHRVIRG